MANIKIVLADTDDKYLMPLERKFIDGLEDKADLIVITDPDYLKEYFSEPQRVDILIINEELYDAELERHNIASVFILTEQELLNNNTGDAEANRIYKYTSVKEIYAEIIGKSSARSETLNTKEETKILMMYSPIGGIGKTTVSAALCEALAKYQKKVLLIGIDSLQTIGSVIPQLPFMESGTEKLLIEKSEYVYEAVKTKIINRTFDLLPPFHLSLPSLNIKGEDYINLINGIRDSKDYDYVIVDGATGFTEDLSRLMGVADHTIILAGQDKNAVYKLDCLLRNIDCSDNDRFVFVCNKYRNNRENFLANGYMTNFCRVSEYIELWTENSASEEGVLTNNRSIQKLALMFI
ncbi:AAA family ATPase [Anaerocolumna sp. AGMB13020]|uniref:AAA family ATPase n=1 Tax=Anaerocolumna sp. AGMB13020 TaxID=3081750 RepID=UPI002954E069|nr:AAA family ATPase [Anaerocolumna sp. AGMB13020]WOO37836.1 AAA family ATPase [Anaerocolumna sp. AGMB13020]